MKRSPLGIIFLTIFLDLVGFGIVLPLLPRFAAQHQAAEWQIGLLMGTYSLMQFFFAPVWGRLSDRIGRRPVLLFSITGSALSYLLFAFAPNLTMLFLSRLVAGIMAANLAAAQAYVADVTTPENRTRGMGMVGAAFGLGFVLGPALAGGVSHWAIGAGHSPQLAVGLVAAGFSAVDLLLAAARLPESLPKELRQKAQAPSGSRLERMAATLRNPATALPVGVFFLSTVAWSQLEPTLARLTQEDYRFNEAQTGYLFAFLGLIVALIQGGYAGRAARKSGEGRLVLTGTCLLVLGLVLLPVAPPPLLYVAVALAGMGQAMSVPGLQSLISKGASADSQGSTLGVTQGFASLGRVLGPAVGGALFGLNHAWPFWFGAALMLVGIGLAVRIVGRARTAQEHGDSVTA